MAKQDWRDALGHLSIQQVADGVEYCRKHLKWPPSIPEFIECCENWEQLLPSRHETYQEACQASYPNQSHAWSHPAVYHAAKMVGLYELRTSSIKKTKAAFEDAYANTIKQLKDGKRLTMPETPKLPHQTTKTNPDSTISRQALDQMHALLKSK